MDWSMRYTFHTGYEPPGMRPQFLESVGAADPVAHIRYAAEQGVAGVLYPWAMDRPPAEVAGVADALNETGLRSSCIVVGDSAVLFTPFWSDRSAAGRAKLAGVMLRACKAAIAVRAGVLAAFVMSNAEGPDEDRQREAAMRNLQDMSVLAADHGLRIGLEPMMLPGLLFQTLESALAAVRSADRPDVGIIFDTAHVAAMAEDLLPAFLKSFDRLVLLQLADSPGRVEPGAGALDIRAVAAEAVRSGYSGMVDLEHGWSLPGLDGERRGLERLRAFDRALRDAAGAVPTAAHAPAM